jgi:hypothetical protein
MTTTRKTDAPPRHPVIVFIERARCPACDSPNLRTYRSTDQHDGSTLRHCVCRDCLTRIHVVVE